MGLVNVVLFQLYMQLDAEVRDEEYLFGDQKYVCSVNVVLFQLYSDENVGMFVFEFCCTKISIHTGTALKDWMK